MTSTHPPEYQRLRRAACRIFDAALRAVEPGRLVEKYLSIEGRTVLVDGTPFPLGEEGRVLVLAAGKAAGPMSRAAVEILGPLVSEGLAVARELHGEPGGPLPLVEAGHPVPDERSCSAARRMIDLARAARPGDLVLCLFSGGASALLCAPAPPLDLEQFRTATEHLIRCGAGIDQINCVRKHLSSIKGGQLARVVGPAALATLLLSDVVGDSPQVIASGPTVPDSSTFAEALDVLETRGISGILPRPVIQRLRRGAAGEIEETPGSGDPCFHGSVARVVGCNSDALAGAASEARLLGFQVVVEPQPVTGEAREAVRKIVERAGSPSRPSCFLSGGETTVTLPAGHGSGGRNMELALAAAPLLAERPPTLLLSAGTDGSDGSTDAAGAISDGSTLNRAEQAGLDTQAALLAHDSFPFFQTLGDLVVTGPTGTNVMDLQIVLADPSDAWK